MQPIQGLLSAQFPSFISPEQLEYMNTKGESNATMGASTESRAPILTVLNDFCVVFLLLFMINVLLVPKNIRECTTGVYYSLKIKD